MIIKCVCVAVFLQYGVDNEVFSEESWPIHTVGCSLWPTNTGSEWVWPSTWSVFTVVMIEFQALACPLTIALSIAPAEVLVIYAPIKGTFFIVLMW